MHHQNRNSFHSHRTSTHTSTTLNLFIPSLHDASPLETSLMVPTSNTPGAIRKAAVFAHPYGPLGGSLHDVVVQHFATTLVTRGYIVAIFNFRGVGKSKGHTTWTGRAETGDYAAIAAWVLNFSSALPQASDGIQLLLGGYSYGGLIAGQCPPVPSLLSTLSSPPSEAFRTSVAAGTKSAERWYESHSDVGRTSYSGVRSPASPTTQTESLERPVSMLFLSEPPTSGLEGVEISTRYLLVSPPLPPVSTFLLPSFSFSSSAESVIAPPTARARPGIKVLAAWGDEDIFTGVKKYQRWSEKMGGGLETRFQGVEVEGAGHFWGEKWLEEVDKVLERWLGDV